MDRIIVHHCRRSEGGGIDVHTSRGVIPGVNENVARVQFGGGDLDYLLTADGEAGAFTLRDADFADFVKHSRADTCDVCGALLAGDDGTDRCPGCDEACELCGDALEEGDGDNWDGLCPGCADAVSNRMDDRGIDREKAIEVVRGEREAEAK